MTWISKQIVSCRWCRVCSELHRAFLQFRVFLSSAYRLFLQYRMFRTFRPRAAVAASSATLTNQSELSPQGPTWAARWARAQKQTQHLLTVLTLVVSLVSTYGLRMASLINAPWAVTWQRKIRTYNNLLGIKIRTYVKYLRHRIVLGTSRARIYEDRRGNSRSNRLSFI